MVLYDLPFICWLVKSESDFWLSHLLELRTFVTHNLEKDPGSKKVQ